MFLPTAKEATINYDDVVAYIVQRGNMGSTEKIDTLAKEIEEYLSQRDINKATVIDIQQGIWHRAGACVFMLRKTVRHNWKHYLFTMDEGRSYVIELPRKVVSLADAYESLKPKILQDNPDIPGVRRQGEWFFVPAKNDDGTSVEGFDGLASYLGCSVKAIKAEITSYREKASKANKTGWGVLTGSWATKHTATQYAMLPQKGRSNGHVAKNLFEYRGNIYVSGGVYHTSGDHRACQLGKTWHLAYEGQDVSSYDFVGRID
jgi:hypothetical protein